MFWKEFLILNNIIIVIKSETVNIPNLGKIQGSVGPTSWTFKNIFQFRGIPYGESTGKARRFQPPVAKAPWIGSEINAIDSAKPCPHFDHIKGLTAEQLNGDLEDCLNLNVYSKNLTSKMPVMFFVHGGYFVREESSFYPPNHLLESNIVLVVVNYRVGALGFAATNTKEIPGNVGVLDVFLALKWVKSNIQYFGGDTDKITVFGQSAGAVIVSLLVISPGVPQGFFERAILQSGSILSNWAVDQNPIKCSQEICKYLNCTNCENIDEVNNCLKSASVEKLIEAVQKGKNTQPRIALGDLNNLLPIMPKLIMSNENFDKKYQIMAGVTKNDGSYFLASFFDSIKKAGKIDLNNINPMKLLPNYIETSCEYKDDNGVIFSLVSNIMFEDFDVQNKNYNAAWQKFVDFASVCSIKAPLMTFMELYIQNAPYNNQSHYLYSFDYSGDVTRVRGDYPFKIGVTHSDEMFYLFPYKNEELRKSEDIEMGKFLVTYWANFASRGAPQASDYEFEPIKNNETILSYNSIGKFLRFEKNFMKTFSTITVESNAEKLELKSILMLLTSNLVLKLF